VQNTSSVHFANRLASVLVECYRVLKKDGLLVFTYHHSRGEGWISLYTAIRKAGFLISFTYPIKSEMSVAVPIRQSGKPINYDLIIVCRKFRQ